MANITLALILFKQYTFIYIKPRTYNLMLYFKDDFNLKLKYTFFSLKLNFISIIK